MRGAYNSKVLNACEVAGYSRRIVDEEKVSHSQSYLKMQTVTYGMWGGGVGIHQSTDQSGPVA